MPRLLLAAVALAVLGVVSLAALLTASPAPQTPDVAAPPENAAAEPTAAQPQASPTPLSFDDDVAYLAETAEQLLTWLQEASAQAAQLQAATNLPLSQPSQQDQFVIEPQDDDASQATGETDTGSDDPPTPTTTRRDQQDDPPPTDDDLPSGGQAQVQDGEEPGFAVSHQESCDAQGNCVSSRSVAVASGGNSVARSSSNIPGRANSRTLAGGEDCDSGGGGPPVVHSELNPDGSYSYSLEYSVGAACVTSDNDQEDDDRP